MLSSDEVREIAAMHLKVQPDSISVKTRVFTWNFSHTDYEQVKRSNKSIPVGAPSPLPFGAGYYQLRSRFSIKRNPNKLYYLLDYNLQKSGKAVVKTARLLLDKVPVFALQRSSRMAHYQTKDGKTGYYQKVPKDFLNVLFDSTDISVYMMDETGYQSARFTLQLVVKEITII